MAPAPLNNDLGLRVEVHVDEGRWQSTKISGLSICLLEYHSGERSRMTALFKLGDAAHGCAAHSNISDGGAAYGGAAYGGASDKNVTEYANEGVFDVVRIPANDLELLVQHGLVADDCTEYLHPFYIRQPTDQNGNNQHFTLHPGSQNKPQNQSQLEFYVATGQLAATDKQRRCINLNDHSLWLPGPVKHTEVMPLHMHEGNNSMLVRWLDSASFRPRLDPMGEEVLVISGTLTDKNGSYSAGSWIRNPVTTWQSWGGVSGTIIYYKNGHFGS